MAGTGLSQACVRAATGSHSLSLSGALRQQEAKQGTWPRPWGSLGGREQGGRAMAVIIFPVAECFSLLQEWFSKADSSSADPEGHLQLLRVNNVLFHQDGVFRAF